MKRLTAFILCLAMIFALAACTAAPAADDGKKTETTDQTTTNTPTQAEKPAEENSLAGKKIEMATRTSGKSNELLTALIAQFKEHGRNQRRILQTPVFAEKESIRRRNKTNSRRNCRPHTIIVRSSKASRPMTCRWNRWRKRGTGPSTRYGAIKYRVRHQSARTQHLTQTADNAHHVRRRNATFVFLPNFFSPTRPPICRAISSKSKGTVIPTS